MNVFPIKPLAASFQVSGNSLLVLISLLDSIQQYGQPYYVTLAHLSKKCGLRSEAETQQHLKNLTHQKVIRSSYLRLHPKAALLLYRIVLPSTILKKSKG